MNLLRQSDLLLMEIKELPKKLKKISSGTKNVLALGEVTGHSHVLTTDIEIDVFEEYAIKYFNLPVKAELSHEEHRKLAIAPAPYKVIVEKEFDYFLAETRKVLD